MGAPKLSFLAASSLVRLGVTRLATSLKRGEERGGSLWTVMRSRTRTKTKGVGVQIEEPKSRVIAYL